jgi:hypothetical protein
MRSRLPSTRCPTTVSIRPASDVTGRSGIAWRDVPEATLLAAYKAQGAYTDCLECHVPQQVDLPRLIAAFYSSRAFRAERWAIGALLGMPAGAADVALLASGDAQRFSAWTVEARIDDQILLCDYQRRTRSWLMVAPTGQGTAVRFGSAVVPASNRRDDWLFSMLTGVHRAYARVLLHSACGDLHN